MSFLVIEEEADPPTERAMVDGEDVVHIDHRDVAESAAPG